MRKRQRKKNDKQKYPILRILYDFKAIEVVSSMYVLHRYNLKEQYNIETAVFDYTLDSRT